MTSQDCTLLYRGNRATCSSLDSSDACVMDGKMNLNDAMLAGDAFYTRTGNCIRRDVCTTGRVNALIPACTMYVAS